jgi:hypothetical protein
LGTLRSIQYKKNHAAEKLWETDFISHEERKKWIEHYVERETTVARKRVQDTERAMMQEQEHMGNVAKG